MVQYARWLLVPAVLVGLLAGGPAHASKADPQKLAPARIISDEAGLFSTEAISKANREIAAIKKEFGKDLAIDTFITVKRPADLNKDDKEAVKKFFNEWAIDRFARQGINGIQVVLVKDPKILRVTVGDKTLKDKLFTDGNRSELAKIFGERLGVDKAKNDEALQAATTFVRQTLARNQAALASSTATGRQQQEGVPWVRYLLIFLAIIFVLWIVMAVIRALSGAGGYGGGYGGGGGGGFMSGLLGGLFGAMAGMWLYNNLFGGHAHASDMGSAGGADAGAGTDVGGDATTGGSEYDGGGGGDWGGGDAGGGGGGGDWGGGGGGDWGGGGGDWGGGGGGGDW